MDKIEEYEFEEYIGEEDYYCAYYGCTTLVNSINEFYLTVWRNTTFISKTYKNYNYNYLSLLKHAKPQGKQCDKGYKQCGILDSFNQTLCLLENETCPLNQIELSNSDKPSDIFTNKSAVTITLLNDNKTYLHTSNAEINSTIITEIVLGPESVCLDSEERKLGPPYYENESSSTEGICNRYFGCEIDYNYISLDEYSKFNVYNENGIINKIQEFINYSYPLEELNNYTLHLYKRNYIGFNLTCLEDQVLNEESFNFVKKYSLGIFGCNLFIIIIVFVQVFLYIIRFLLTYDNDNNKEDSYFYLLIFSIPISPLLSLSFGLSLASRNLIFKCADTPIPEAFINSDKLDLTLIIVSFGLYIFMVVSNYIIYIINKDYVSNICDKISDYCKKQKEKRDLARLGFTKEETKAELKTY